MRMELLAPSDKTKPGTENIRGFNLEVFKFTITEVTKLPLQHKTSKISIISFAKPGLTQDLHIVQKG
jgi:hypothetical protein